MDRYAPKPSDSPAVAAWRERMAGAEAKAIYKERAATAECVNAQARNRGLIQLRVRGQLKAKAIALWHDAGLTGWRTHYLLNGYELDFVFPEHRLAVEVDGWAWHHDVETFRRDRQRHGAS